MTHYTIREEKSDLVTKIAAGIVAVVVATLFVACSVAVDIKHSRTPATDTICVPYPAICEMVRK